MKLFKQLFCRHKWKLNWWQWSNGVFGEHPLFIQAEYKCKKCGKIKYEYPPQDVWILYYTANPDKEREWQ